MAYELKDGQGSLFKNDKDGVETRPDYRGELKINGTIYRVSGWLKEGQKGKWMSLSADEKGAYPVKGAELQAKVARGDDIPF